MIPRSSLIFRPPEIGLRMPVKQYGSSDRLQWV